MDMAGRFGMRSSTKLDPYLPLALPLTTSYMLQFALIV